MENSFAQILSRPQVAFHAFQEMSVFISIKLLTKKTIMNTIIIISMISIHYSVLPRFSEGQGAIGKGHFSAVNGPSKRHFSAVNGPSKGHFSAVNG